MPDYTFAAPNGKKIRVTGDTPPSEADIDEIFKAAGVDTAPTVAGPHPEAAIRATNVTDPVTLGDVKDDPIGAMKRVGAIVGKDVSDPKLWLMIAASYFAPKVFSAAAPVVSRAAANAGRMGRAGAAGVLDTAATVLDNPVAGTISPRAAQAGRLAGHAADMIRPAAAAPPTVPPPPVAAAPAPAPPQPPPARPTTTGTSWQPAQIPQPVTRPVAVPAAAAAPMEPVAPIVSPAAASPSVEAPAPRLSPQMVLNELALAARRAKTTLSPADYEALQLVVADGTAPVDAVAALVRARMSPAEALKASSSFSSLPTDAERTFPTNKGGLPARAPRATKR